MTAHEQVEAWNRSHPTKTPVAVRRDNGEILKTETKSEAFVARNGLAVIFVLGISGYYLLERVKPEEVNA
jgi:hypothetical protein